MQVVVRPHLLSTREQTVRYFSYGTTIAEIADSLGEIDPAVRQHNLVALVNGETLPREQWHERRLLQSDSKVEFAVALQGGGGRGKSILAVVAMIALSVVTAGIATAALGAMGMAAEGTAFLIAKAGVMLVGSLLIHAIFAPPRTPTSKADKVSPTYSFSGQSNQPRRYARLPRIYGRHRYVADVAAMPYTVNVGDDVYLYALYSFGYAELVLEDFRIGQNPLTNYTDYDIRLHTNFTDSSQLELYKSDIWQDSVSFEVKQTTPVVVTTQELAEHAIIDISFAQGLVALNKDGGQEYLDSDMKFEYRLLGSTDWLPMPMSMSQTPSRGQANMNLKFYLGQQFYPGIVTQNGPDNTVITPGFPAGTNTFVGWAPVDVGPNPGTEIMVGPYHLVVDTIVPRSDVPMTYDGRQYMPYTTTTTQGLPGDLPLTGDQIYMYAGSTVAAVAGSTNTLHFHEKKAQPFTVSATADFAVPGQYEIRITKVEADFPDDETDSETKHAWRRVITAVRTLRSQPPIKPEVPISIVELRIKATGQLNGTIEEFSAIATSILRVWNFGANAWANFATRNPAWIYLDILTGTANSRPLADNRIDIESIKLWALRCDQIDAPFVGPMGTCDVVVDRDYTLWELMQNVAAAGRAAPTMKDNRYSVLLDSADRAPVQMFTNRNSKGLKSTRTYQDEPHAFRVKWIDALNNYTEAETIVYNTGHDSLNTTVFEDLQSFGMTRAEQVLRWGRYMLAQAKLRQERFTIDVDIEHIVCTRGDLVLVAHDVIEVGGDPSRVVEVVGNRLFVDAPPTRDDVFDFTAYGIRVRTSNGFIGPVLDVTGMGNDGELDYIDVVGDLSGITADNLLVFGPKSEVVGEYIVDSIRPGTDLAATISLEELAPAVYNAEYTGLETLTYTPQGGGMLAPPVENLTITITVVYSGNTPMATVRAAWRPAQGMPYQPEDYRVWLITPTGNEEYLGATKQLSWTLDAVDLTTLNGYTYVFRVRPFYGARGMGPGVESSLVVEYAPRLAPPLVDNFDVQNLSGGTRRYLWNYDITTPANIPGIRVRYLNGSVANPVWLNGADLVESGDYVIRNGEELAAPPGAGTFTFMAKAVDDHGQLSDGTFVLIRELTATDVVDLSPPPTPTGFTALGGFGIVAFSQDEPGYSQGGGHAYTQVYAASVPSGGPEPTFADAAPFTTFLGAAGTAGAEPATDYRFWAKWVANSKVMSVDPAGPVAAQTSIDVAATIAALAGQIGSSSLDVALTSRIVSVENKTQSNPNLLPYGGFEQGMIKWNNGTGLAGPVQMADSTFGLYALFGPTEGGAPNIYSDFFSLGAGGTYTISADTELRYKTGIAPNGYIVLEILCYTSGGVFVGEILGPQNPVDHSFSIANDTVRTTYFASGVAPVGTTQARARISWTGSVALAGARQVKVEAGNKPTKYTQEATTVAQQTSINGLNAQYTVKIDTNGYVTGIGLGSTLVGAVPTSAFSVRADSFYVANPAGPGIAPSTPFIVRTTPTTLNGQTIPVGVYMQQAYIQNGSIDSVKIGLAVITDAHIASLSADKITAGLLVAARIDSRGLSLKDSVGNVIFSSGTTGINFNTVGLSSRNFAPSIFRTGWVYGDTAGGNAGARSSGLQYAHDGWYLYLPGTTGQYELWNTPAMTIPVQGLVVSFSAYANAVGTRTLNFDISPGYTGGSVTVTQSVVRYSAVLSPVAGANGSGALRFIALTSSVPLVIFDIQVEANIAGIPTNWKHSDYDIITPSNPLTPTNATTYIAAATITSAFIADLTVDTLKIANNAVTVPLSSSTTAIVATGNAAFGTGTVVGKTGLGNLPAGTAVFVVSTAIASSSPSAPTANIWLILGSAATPAVGQAVGGYGNPNTPPGGTQVTMSAFSKQTFSKMFTIPSAGDWCFALIANTPAGDSIGFTVDIIAFGAKK